MGHKVLFFLHFKQYQLDRILAWIHPYDYVDKISYQQVQGLLAIGSGGLFGKGVHGIEVYVPVRESDMVLLLSGKPGALWAVPPLFFSILLVLSSFSSWLAEQFAFLYVHLCRPHFFAGLSNGGEYRCGDWTVAVKRYSASVLSQGGTSLVMAITSLGFVKGREAAT